MLLAYRAVRRVGPRSIGERRQRRQARRTRDCAAPASSSVTAHKVHVHPPGRQRAGLPLGERAAEILPILRGHPRTKPTRVCGSWHVVDGACILIRDDSQGEALAAFIARQPDWASPVTTSAKAGAQSGVRLGSASEPRWPRDRSGFR
jgi:hypothetical protein